MLLFPTSLRELAYIDASNCLNVAIRVGRTTGCFRALYAAERCQRIALATVIGSPARGYVSPQRIAGRCLLEDGSDDVAILAVEQRADAGGAREGELLLVEAE